MCVAVCAHECMFIYCQGSESSVCLVDLGLHLYCNNYSTGVDPDPPYCGRY